MKSYGVTIEIKPLQQYFHMELFVFNLYVVQLLSFSVDFLWCDHSNQTSLTVLSQGAIHLVCSSN